MISGRILNIALIVWFSMTMTVSGDDRMEREAGTSQSMLLTLSDAVDLAMTRNIDLKNDTLDVDISESVFRAGMAPYSPKLQINANSDWERHDVGDGSDGYNGSNGSDDSSLEQHFSTEISKRFAMTGGTLALYSDVIRHDDSEAGLLDVVQENPGRYSNTVGFRMNQPLLKDIGPWGDAITVRQNRLTLENNRIDYVRTLRQTVLDIITLYFSVMKQEKLVSVAVRSVADARVHLQNSRIKLDEGLVAQMDVSQAELQLARQQTTLIRAEQSAASGMDALKIKLNLPMDQLITLEDPPDHLPESIESDDAVREALANRPELTVLINDIRSAELSVQSSANRRLPELDLNVNAETTRQKVPLRDSFEADPETWNFQLGFSYTFGDRSPRETLLQDRIRLVKLRNGLESRRLTIEKEVRDEVRSYRALVEAMTVSAKAKDIAEKNLELANRSYQEGLTGNLDLIKAQDDLIAAGIAYYSDMLDLAVAKARIIYALGRDIDPDHLVLGDGRADPEAGTTEPGAGTEGLSDEP